MRGTLDKHCRCAEEAGDALMALARGRRPQRIDRLLAGFRRRAVDAAAVDHVPAVGVRAGAVPAEPRDFRQGRGAEPPQLADQRADATAVARALELAGFAGPARQSAGLARGGRRREVAAGAAASPRGRLGRRGDRPHRRAVGRSRQRARRQPARAVAGRAAQPADRRAAQADRRAGGRPRRFGNPRPRIQHQDRRPRPPPERRAGAARAGAQPLPLGFLRSAARDPVRSREHPHRRRSLRVPVGGAVRVGRRGDQRRRPGRDEEACRRHHRAAEGDPAGDQLGAARRRPHRQQAAVRAPAATATIGSCPRRARPPS